MVGSAVHWWFWEFLWVWPLPYQPSEWPPLRVETTWAVTLCQLLRFMIHCCEHSILSEPVASCWWACCYSYPPFEVVDGFLS